MSGSRLLCLMGPVRMMNIFSPKQLLSLPSPVVRFRCYSSTVEQHPWPEWVSFVDRLKSKGYFTETSEEEGSLYTNMTLLKDACLSFSRDRSDIFKKLSAQDMRAVAEKGCPNLFRKVVNSGKRLRLHLDLDEGAVCGPCTLRGSCDRANVVLKDDEGVARTVDVVRVLLSYALDPALISDGAMPAGKELIEVSSRKLLSELIELSEAPFDPEHPRPDPRTSPTKKQSLGSRKAEGSEDVVAKRDSFGLKGEMSKRGSNFEVKKGDWVCSKCNFMNFSRNAQCLKCKAEGPIPEAHVVQEMKKGDWNCPQCAFMNFASKTKCKRCQEPRPKRQLNPGEWECPSCDFLNYRKNMVCKKCNVDRPRDTRVHSKYEEQLWKKPHQHS